MLPVESEAEAANLRRRSAELERRARQLRSDRSASAAKALGPLAADSHVEAAQPQTVVHGLSAQQDQLGTRSVPAISVGALQALSEDSALDSSSLLLAEQPAQLHQPGTAGVQPMKRPRQGVQQIMASDVQENTRQPATAPGADPAALTGPQRAPKTAETAPGLVVWGTVKGWPPWPAIVLTAEEMDVAGVVGQHGNIVKGQPNSSARQCQRCMNAILALHATCAYMYWPWHDCP